MRNFATSVLAIALALGTSIGTAHAASPIMWQWELKGGFFSPGIDDEEGLTGSPYESVYGNEGAFLFMTELDLQFVRSVAGSSAIGFGIGFMSADGKSLDPDSGDKPGDTTAFELMPMQLAYVHHFDYLALNHSVPLVPFVKFGADYWAWWVLDPGDDIARTDDGEKAMGGTWGYHTSAGVKFLLDWVDPSSAQTFDLEMGVNNSYVFFEYQSATVDDFGSSTSFNLGNDSFMFGLSFEM